MAVKKKNPKRKRNTRSTRNTVLQNTSEKKSINTRNRKPKTDLQRYVISDYNTGSDAKWVTSK